MSTFCSYLSPLTLGSRKLPSFPFPGHFPLASSGLHVFGQNDGKSSGGDRRWCYAKGKLLEIMDTRSTSSRIPLPLITSCSYVLPTIKAWSLWNFKNFGNFIIFRLTAVKCNFYLRTTAKEHQINFQMAIKQNIGQLYRVRVSQTFGPNDKTPSLKAIKSRARASKQLFMLKVNWAQY